MDKQYIVLGLGIFGSSLVKTLAEYGCEVIAVDKDAECVQRIADYATKAVIGDVTDKQLLIDLGAEEFDIGIVAIGDDLESAVLATMNLKELNVPTVVVKAKNKRFKTVLERVGADRVVRPEKEMGEKVAKSFLRNNIQDLIEIDDENSIVEIKIPKAWDNKSLVQLDLRKKYGMNVLGKRNQDTHKLEMGMNPNAPLKAGDVYVMVAQTDKIEKFDYLS